MTSIDGKVLTFEELIQVPGRVSFLDETKLRKCRQTLASCNPVEFLPNAVWESYITEKDGRTSLEPYSFRMYKICMSGVLKSGEKVTVVLDNVLPFGELRVPRPPPDADGQPVAVGCEVWREHTQVFLRRVLAICKEQGFKLKESHVVSGATVKEYADRADFVQLCFSSLGERKKMIEYFDSQKYETTHDDATCYYRMVSRDTQTPWTNWCTIRDYRVTKKHAFFNSLYTITVDYRKMQAYTGDVFADPDLRQDLTLELLWDIESRDPVATEEIPQPLSSTFTMPNISMSFAWIDAGLCPVNACSPHDAAYDWRRPQGHLAQFNITTMMTAPMPNRTTIMCRNRSEQIMAFGVIWRKFQPDLDVQFNGHRYDWWCFTEVARQLNLLEFLERNLSMTDLALYRQIEEKTFQNPKAPFTDPSLPQPEKRAWGGYTHWKRYGFKISAELQNVPGACLNYPGYISVDMMMQLRAAFNNPEKYSMHKFLGDFQLGDKVEMNYREMFMRFDGNHALFEMLKRDTATVAALDDLHPEAVLACAARHDADRASRGESTRTIYKRYTLGREVRVEGAELVAYNMRYAMSADVEIVAGRAEISRATVLEAVEAAMADMMEVAEYCIVDGLRCHDLLVKTQFVRDKRQIGVLSFTTMDDCVYRANGMKVRQMIIAKAQARSYHVSNRAPKHIEKGKYPGAYVFPPYKGIATAKPSPVEMRHGAICKDGTRKPLDAKYAAWQVMPQTEFDRVLTKVAECGIWLEDYLPATTAGAIPTEYPDRRVWATIAAARYKGIKQPNETPEAFSARYEQIVVGRWATIYCARYDVQHARFEDVPYEEWLSTFKGDLVGEWSNTTIEWLLGDSHYPIAGLDFSSLYPSLIMTYNFSPEMMVHSLERALELMSQGKKIHSVNFPFNGRIIKGWSVRSSYPERQDEIAGLLKSLINLSKQDDPNGVVEAQLNDKLEQAMVATEFGLFPTVLKDLFDQRVALKAHLKPLTHRLEEFKLMTAEEFAACAEEYSIVIGKWNYLNSKQKALKVFMNTFYGESGNAMSPLRVLALAGGVTSGGQYNIKKVAQLVQALGCRIYYGDSVTGDTPVLLKEEIEGREPWIMVRTFNDITAWCETQTEKQLSEEWNHRWIWSANGWARIKNVIRHKTAKKIYRVSTHTGLVDVTEDHSLLDPKCNKIQPKDCSVGTELRHGYPMAMVPPRDMYKMYNYATDEPATQIECLAFIYGFFFGDGSCGRYDCSSGIKHSWALNNQDQAVLDRLLRYLPVAHPGRAFKQLDTLESSGVYKIVPVGDIKGMVEAYRPQFYDSEKYKRVPDMIMNSTLTVRKYFMQGYYCADGAKTNGKRSGSANTLFSNKGKVGTAGLYYIAKSLGYKCSVSCRSDKLDIFKLTCTFNAQRKAPHKIKSIGVVAENTSRWVYDITTEDGTFSAGIGEIVVHNTDSVYISMPRDTFVTEDRKYYSLPYSEFSAASKIAYFDAVVTESFKLIKAVNKSVNDALEADNGTRFLNMAFEEFLYPAMFFSKKKYGGVEHAGTFNHAFFTKAFKGTAADAKELFVRGLEFVKKGVSEMLKDISVSILVETLGIENIATIDVIVERKIEEIYTRRDIEYEKFIMTASYRPNKQNVKVHTFHRRMEALGIAPEPLDRFRYVMVKKYPFKYDLKGKKTELSVGDRMEYADRARLLNMEIDLDYYMGASVCGQLARFISWRDDFAVEPRDDTDEAYNDAEKKNITAAQKYIERCYERWSEKHTSKGPALRTLYKKVNGVFHEEFSAVMRVSNIWQMENATTATAAKMADDEKNHVQQAYEENQCLFQTIIQHVDKQVVRESRREAERIIARMPLTDAAYAGTMLGCYRDLLASRRALSSRRLPVLHQKLRARVQQLRKLFAKRDNILEQCIAGLTTSVGIDQENFSTLEPIIARIEQLDTVALRHKINREIGTTVTHHDFLVLGEIDELYISILTLHKLVRVTEVVTEELSNYIHYKLGGMPVVDHLADLDDWMADNIDD